MKPELPTIDILRIMDMIPHRYPILLVDRIIDYVAGESAVGLKNVTMNEPHFQGHFPRMPVMPGVLIVEAMAQTSAILVVQTMGKEAEGKLVYFMSIDNAKFRRAGDAGRYALHPRQKRTQPWRRMEVQRRGEG